MGGNAFAASGVYTPRMPPDVYTRVLRETLTKLRTVYEQVEPNIDAPDKTDYGDIDILVVSPSGKPDSKEVAALLGAMHFIEGKGNDTVNYAVPWPETDQSIIESSQSPAGEDEPGGITRYIQIDINHNRDRSELEFTQFLHAHGDFWIMIRTIIRPYGLTCADGGLYINIPELETLDKRRSRVKLVEDPNDILRYLDLDVNPFWTKFKTREDLMQYIATCRFYNPSRLCGKGDRPQFHMKKEAKKYRQRPMYAYWLEVFLPAHQDLARGRSAEMSCEDVVNEAKGMQHEFATAYEHQKAIGLREKEVAALWADIRRNIPCEGPILGCAMKALKGQIEDMSTTASDAALRDAQKAFHAGQFDIVKKWSLENWKKLAAAQEEADRERMRQTLEEKRW